MHRQGQIVELILEDGERLARMAAAELVPAPGQYAGRQSRPPSETTKRQTLLPVRFTIRIRRLRFYRRAALESFLGSAGTYAVHWGTVELPILRRGPGALDSSAVRLRG
jgi:hypothetical protein